MITRHTCREWAATALSPGCVVVVLALRRSPSLTVDERPIEQLTAAAADIIVGWVPAASSA